MKFSASNKEVGGIETRNLCPVKKPCTRDGGGTRGETTATRDM